MGSLPRIVMPWETDRRKLIKDFITQEVKTVKALDMRIVAVARPALKVGQVDQTFGLYKSTATHLEEAEVMDSVIPVIKKLLTIGPNVMRGVDVSPLPTGGCETQSYTKLQIAVVVAHMFINAFHGYVYMDKSIDMELYSEPTLTGIFRNQNAFPLACILEYFRQVGENMNDKGWCQQRVMYRRFSMTKEEYDKKLGENRTIDDIYSGECGFDDADNAMRIVSANMYVGGKLFEGPCTQEEVVMLTRPEMLMLLLIAPHPMSDGSSINCVIGAEKMIKFGGFGTGLYFEGMYVDSGVTIVSTSKGYRVSQIAHAFVRPIQASSVDMQYLGAFQRDIYRLVVGFMSIPQPAGHSIAIGNFSYEFSACPSHLRVIQATIAATVAGQICAYCTNDAKLRDNISLFAEWVKGRNVSTLIEIYKREVGENWSKDGEDMEIEVLNTVMAVF